MTKNSSSTSTPGDDRVLESAQRSLEQRRRQQGLGGVETALASVSQLRPTSGTASSIPVENAVPIRTAPNLDATGYYDFDLAEFPWSVLSKNHRPSGDAPLIHRSHYTNQETGERVERVFETFPAPPPKGMTGPQFPGPTGFALTYALLQLYVEQGCTDDKIVFGSRRHLCRRLNLDPSGKNITRIGRELSILCGIRLRAENAYWEPRQKGYIHMDMWSPFAGAFYLTAKPGFGSQEELPFGYVQVHPQLQRIAQSRGFFALGFPHTFFLTLTPLEQRLAVFLARRFRHQSLIRLDVEDVCAAMPILSAAAKGRRQVLKKTFESLMKKGFPLLRDARIRASKGRYLAEFQRKEKPKPERPVGSFQVDVPLEDRERRLVAQLISAADDPGAFYWYAHCISTLGYDACARALGNFRELYIQGDQPIRTTKGKAMTGVLKGIANEMNIQIGKQ